jgi:hypothetical protein
MRRFGVCLGSLTVVLLWGCGIHYGFTQGGGLPSHIRTVAILPFENQTSSPEIGKEIYDQMRTELQKRLGLRDAPQERADAIVRGTIVSYDADVPVSFSANPTQAVSARRRLQVTVDVSIVEQSNGKVLYQAKGRREEGEYAERAEAEGRRQAVQRILDAIVEGMQSQC